MDTNLGFICEKCHTRLQVARTVNPCPGRVVRYRKCPKCRQYVVTEERVRIKKFPLLPVSIDSQMQQIMTRE